MTTIKPDFTLQAVKSTNISHLGYCEKTKNMLVSFNHGGEYHFSDVDRKTYDAFVNSKSIGKHFHLNIRGKFESLKVNKS